MTEYGKSASLTKEQLQTILDTERIRRHLIKVGLINHRGEIIPEDNHQYRFKRRRNTLARSHQRELKHPTFVRRPLISASPRRRLETHESFPQSSSRPLNPHANERRRKSASTGQSKQTNNTSTSTRLSSSNQFTCEQNVLLRRAVSPKIITAAERCMVGIKYFGPEMIIEYDREWFEPNGDEILIMQQHCGGENLMVFKGSLKPDEQFLFQSRRHINYPFALAFYVNGVIENRLSVCCEARCNNMRIGGKNGVFAIVSVEKPTTCRRCRFEQRMKQIKESEEKSKEVNKQGQTSISPSKPLHSNRSDPKGLTKGDSKPADTPRSSSASSDKPTDNQSPPAGSNGTHMSKINSMNTPPSSSASNDKPIPISKPEDISRSSSRSSDTPTPIFKPTNTHSPPAGSNGTHLSKINSMNTPPSIADFDEENSSTSKDDRSRRLSPEQPFARRSPPKPIRTQTPSPSPGINNSSTSNQNQGRTSQPYSAMSQRKDEIPLRNIPSSPQSNGPNLVRDSIVADSPLRAVPSGLRRSSQESSDKRVSSVQSISSDMSSSDLSTPRRKPNLERPLSSPPVKRRSKLPASSKSKDPSGDRPYAFDFDESSDGAVSSISSARDIATPPRSNGLPRKATRRPSGSSTGTEVGESTSEESGLNFADQPKNVAPTDDL